MDPVVESLLLRSAVLFLMAGSLAGLLVGALLLWRPHRLRVVGDILNRWVSTRRMDRPLERTVTLDPWFYRYRRTSGLLILLASGYIVYFFTVSLDRASAIIGLSKSIGWPQGLTGGLLDALALSAFLGALLAAFVGLFLLFRPSLLRDFEQEANQWISLRRALKPLEVTRHGVDEQVFKYARQAGVALILGSLYTLALLTTWIGHY
ncbi:MAG TPA: hypothetical protein VK149_10600 [Sideroxyarcus sp.]|nr:hypothetical protein [Sideroxyarcus sp.]